MAQQEIFTTAACVRLIEYIQIGHSRTPTQTIGYRRDANGSVECVRYNETLGWRSEAEMTAKR